MLINLRFNYLLLSILQFYLFVSLWFYLQCCWSDCWLARKSKEESRRYPDYCFKHRYEIGLTFNCQKQPMTTKFILESAILSYDCSITMCNITELHYFIIKLIVVIITIVIAAIIVSVIVVVIATIIDIVIVAAPIVYTASLNNKTSLVCYILQVDCYKCITKSQQAASTYTRMTCLRCQRWAYVSGVNWKLMMITKERITG